MVELLSQLPFSGNADGGSITRKRYSVQQDMAPPFDFAQDEKLQSG
jgi:hypothetical protein